MAFLVAVLRTVPTEAFRGGDDLPRASVEVN